MLDQASLERFWSYVDRAAGPEECWPWTGAKDHRGYGRFYYQRRMHQANRVALTLKSAAPDKHHQACHTCDHPSCCNPDHLWWGTRSDNMRDCCAKGRHTQLRKTHCPHGHPLSGDNLIPGRQRHCRACSYERNKIARDRKRQERQNGKV